VRDEILLKRLPPFIFWSYKDLKLTAIDAIALEMNISSDLVKELYRWRIKLGVVQSALESRLINFILNVIKLLLAMSVAFGSEKKNVVIPIGFLIVLLLVPYSFAKSLHVATIIGNRFKITDKDFMILYSCFKFNNNKVDVESGGFGVRNSDSMEMHENPINSRSSIAIRRPDDPMDMDLELANRIIDDRNVPYSESNKSMPRLQRQRGVANIEVMPRLERQRGVANIPTLQRQQGVANIEVMPRLERQQGVMNLRVQSFTSSDTNDSDTDLKVKGILKSNSSNSTNNELELISRMESANNNTSEDSTNPMTITKKDRQKTRVQFFDDEDNRNNDNNNNINTTINQGRRIENDDDDIEQSSNRVSTVLKRFITKNFNSNF